MKKIIFLVATTIAMSSTVFAKVASAPIAGKQRMQVCKKIQDKALASCSKNMCAEQIADTGESECIKDGDFYEGLQICVEEEMPNLIKKFNTKNPGAKLNCDNI